MTIFRLRARLPRKCASIWGGGDVDLVLGVSWASTFVREDLPIMTLQPHSIKARRSLQIFAVKENAHLRLDWPRPKAIC